MATDDFTEDVSAIAALAEPIRRDLYSYVSAQAEPISRDQAADALDLPRHTVKFHLDKLVDEGLLSVQFRRLSGLTGPGAGRPAKLYRRSEREVALALPARDYQLAAEIMATAIDTAVTTGEPILEATRAAARERGAAGSPAAASDPTESLVAALAVRGYEPRRENGHIVMANCPFHTLAQEHTELVCSMNLELVDALVQGQAGSATARLEPHEGRCCVVIDV